MNNILERYSALREISQQKCFYILLAQDCLLLCKLFPFYIMKHFKTYLNIIMVFIVFFQWNFKTKQQKNPSLYVQGYSSKTQYIYSLLLSIRFPLLKQFWHPVRHNAWLHLFCNENQLDNAYRWIQTLLKNPNSLSKSYFIITATFPNTSGFLRTCYIIQHHHLLPKLVVFSYPVSSENVHEPICSLSIKTTLHKDSFWHFTLQVYNSSTDQLFQK